MVKSAQKDKQSATNAAALEYPYYSLDKCLLLGKIVANQGGERVGVPKSVIAVELDMDHGASAFAQLVSSAKKFGIVDGTSQLRLTDAGKEYFFPTSGNSKRVAELSFLSKPAAFAHLIQKMDGSRLPSTEIIGNLLNRDCSVPASWKIRAAQIFVSAAEGLGTLDASRRLRFEAAQHNAGKPSDRNIDNEVGVFGTQDTGNSHAESGKATEPELSKTGGYPPALSAGRDSRPETDMNVWDYSEGGGKIRLETPDPIPRALWERLKRYVEVLEPPME